MNFTLHQFPLESLNEEQKRDLQSTQSVQGKQFVEQYWAESWNTTEPRRSAGTLYEVDEERGVCPSQREIEKYCKMI